MVLVASGGTEVVAIFLRVDAILLINCTPSQVLPQRHKQVPVMQLFETSLNKRLHCHFHAPALSGSS